MNRILIASIAIILTLMFPMIVEAETSITAIGGNPTCGQVSCTGTATLVPLTAVESGSPGRLSVILQNHSSVAVYVGPRSDLTTSNGGIWLGYQGQSVTIDRSSSSASWYCVTSGAAATLGWTEEK